MNKQVKSKKLFYPSLLLAAAFGTLSYLVSLLLCLVGFASVAALGWDWPNWTLAFAFVVGMPLGAWLEVRSFT